MSHVPHKKILQIGYSSFAKAGIQTVIMNIARGLHTEFDMDVLLTSDRPGYYDKEFQRYGTIYRVDCDVTGYGTVRRYCHYCVRPFKQFFYAYRLIKKNRYDIVHIHSGLDGGPMFLAAKAADTKNIVAHSHNTASPEKRTVFARVYRKISRWILHRCATVRIGVSEDANRYLYGDKESQIINNPVELDRFIAAKHTKTNDKLVLLNVGRYSFQKNQSFMLEIVNALLQKGQSVELKLIGFGEDEQMLRRQIKELGLTDVVNLIPGNGDVDIPGLLAESDLFLFPSRYEGLGIVAIEAQAAGCLCLASDVVPRETDLGLCEYFPLEAGADAWANKIIEITNTTGKYALNQEALNRFKAETVQEAFRVLYRSLGQ